LDSFQQYLAESGIAHEPGPSHTPELNGVAERTNQTIHNLVRCALQSAKLPKSFWADALSHALFTFNSVPCRTPVWYANLSSAKSKKGQNLRFSNHRRITSYGQASTITMVSQAFHQLILNHIPNT
jgi:hypothetical protein